MPDTASLALSLPFAIAVSILLGLCIGSFLNVVIYRWPKETTAKGSIKALFWPPSHCACGAPIAWHHNIPVLSWLWLRGKSACCHKPISIRYLFVEAATGVVFGLVAWKLFPNIAQTLLFQGYAAALMAAFFIDLDHMEIPDTITMGGSLLAVALLAFNPFLIPVSRGDAAIGFLVGTSIVAWANFISFPILDRQGMGWGDAKLLAMLGLLMGWKIVAFSFFGGAILGVLAILFQRFALKKLDAAQKGREIPFGPMLITAAFIYFLGGWRLVNLYLSTF